MTCKFRYNHSTTIDYKSIGPPQGVLDPGVYDIGTSNYSLPSKFTLFS